MGWFSGDKKPAAPLTREIGAPPAAPASLLGPLMPPDAAKTRADATAAATLAATRARKRGAAGAQATLLTPTLGATTPAPVLQPKRLVGN